MTRGPGWRRAVLSALAGGLVVAGCGGGSGGKNGGNGGTGGRAAAGGALGTGGATSIGGSTGTGGNASGSGGVSSSGGVTGTGGVTATGGAIATGGASATGGAMATGGASGTGGAIATGGASATGGTSGTGGITATGGATGTGGGASATGGAIATGGIAAAGGTSATGGATGTGGGAGGGGGASQACHFRHDVPSAAPTAILVADRSGSMFDCLSSSNVEPVCPDLADTTWTKLKDAVLPVVEQRQSGVRFGLTAFMGTNPSAGGTCPVLETVAPALGNAGAVAALYNSLPGPPNSTQSGIKWQGPLRHVVELVGAQLMADASPGEKYVVLITDGQTDYCGDGNTLCPPDGVVLQIQRLKQRGITTVVVGRPLTGPFDLPVGVLDAFANAGAGEPTMAPLRAGLTIDALFDQCYGPGLPAEQAPGGWARDFATTGKPAVRGQTLGTYAEVAGPTRALVPDPSAPQQLTDRLADALSGKGCSFALTDGGGAPLVADPARLGEARLLIMGAEITRSDTDGWRLTQAGQLELVGPTCSSWRRSPATSIDFQFLCSAS
jgi:hypothetical protein